MRARTWIFLAACAGGCALQPLGPSHECAPGGCDDANDCTVDRCDALSGTCRHDPLPRDTACDRDRDACNGVDRCDIAGQCLTGAPPKIDDGNPCTTDSCDALTGAISHVPQDGCPPPALWQPLSVAAGPSARTGHSALWTGRSMLVWGGRDDTGTPLGDGASYDPATNSWTPITTQGAPAARHSHSAVWTGGEMIVWGGFAANGYQATGARYAPDRDTWTPLPSVTLAGRTMHGAVWTGGEMIVWGGFDGKKAIADGARYSLAADAWTPMTKTAAPSPRFLFASAWTGSALLVWGGADTFDWLGNGRAYQPALDAWSPLASMDAPGGRQGPATAWTGARLLVWGGWNGGNFFANGAALDPSPGGVWQAMADTAAPSDRQQHAFVWTGSELCVWGGCSGDESGCGIQRDDGGCYAPAGHAPSGMPAWRPIPADPTFPGRVDATAVWTGADLVVFGGLRADKESAGGAKLTLAVLAK
jgi:hypothetical protein